MILRKLEPHLSKSIFLQPSYKVKSCKQFNFENRWQIVGSIRLETLILKEKWIRFWKIFVTAES